MPDGEHNEIYLDHNATTPLMPEVARAMAACEAACSANPASLHRAGRRARQRLEDAREEIGRLLGAEMTGRQPDRVVFTSGGTEANNLAILGLSHQTRNSTPHTLPPLLLSAIEHPSVVGPAEALAARGCHVERLPVDCNGVIARPSWSGASSADLPRLVSAMLGNNETGVLQPVAELAAICNAAGVPLHTDAVQVVGKLPVDFRGLGVAALTASAHKFHGPRGVGVLVLRHDVMVEPLLHGGFQQGGLRPGTESVALVVGMHAALQQWDKQQEARRRHLTELRERFESGLRSGWPGVVVNGAAAARLPHTSNVSFPGLDRQALMVALDLAGVFCSTGSACASGSTDPSPVLLAMGLSRDVVNGALRFSFGMTNTPAEIDAAVQRILHVVQDMPRAVGGESFRRLAE